MRRPRQFASSPRPSRGSLGETVDPHELRSLLATHGGLFSAHLGIQLDGLLSGELFKWFLASLLFGARITESVAVRTYRALERRRLLSPQAIAGADFAELRDVMAEGGYVRYDGITSRKLQGAARKLLDEYEGDLNRLHAAATDAEELMRRLISFWGVGTVTAVIFLRELRGLWPKANPPISDLAQLAASHLKIGDLKHFWSDHAVSGYDFRHFEVALTRIGRDFCRRRRCADAPIPHQEARRRSSNQELGGQVPPQ